MLIPGILAIRHACRTLPSRKRSLQPVGHSSSTLLGWFRPAPIDQYSSLLPPVGVWTVSQFQCGGPTSQYPYPSVGRYPANFLMGRIPNPYRIAPLLPEPCNPSSTSRINPPFGGLSRSKGQVGYALLTRAPVAAIALLQRAAPRLACVKPVASVHPEPGSNSSLYVLYL